MSKGLTIIDKDYTRWVEDLSVRYRQRQIKAAVRVNQELLKYYWELGRDIEEILSVFANPATARCDPWRSNLGMSRFP